MPAYRRFRKGRGRISTRYKYAGSRVRSRTKQRRKFRRRKGRATFKAVKRVAYKNRNLLSKLKSEYKIIAKLERGKFSCNANEQSWSEFSVCDRGIVNSIMDTIPMWDESTSNYTLAQPVTNTTGTFNMTFSQYHEVDVFNNYSIPIWVDVFYLQCKADTSFSPLTLMGQDEADIGYTGSGAFQATTRSLTKEDPGLNYSDFPSPKSLWKTAKKYKFFLRPGYMKKCVAKVKGCRYKKSLNDQHTSTYQRSFKGMIVVIRLRGAYGHDCDDAAGTESGTFGTQPASVDIFTKVIYKMQYNGGAKFKQITRYDNFNSIGVGDTRYTALPDTIVFEALRACPP